MKRILILTFYFGKNPWYLNLFLQSCKSNNDVDFIFFTDISDIQDNIKNLKMINLSFDDFKSTIARHFNFELNIQDAIKLCDIRPSFGEVFQDLIKNYDFWGYCDVDIIFGRIRFFLDENILNLYDVIFSKHEYPSGFFAIYRNNKQINKLYRSSDYKKTFQNNNLLLFDECGGHYDEVCTGVNILDTNYDFDSMHHILERHKGNVNILYDFLSIDTYPGKIIYNNGVLSYNNKFEILLYHLTGFKKNHFFIEKKNVQIKNCRSYYIGRYKITNNNYLSKLKTDLSSLFIPNYYKFLLKTDYFVSNKIKSSKNKKINSGKYRYMKRNLNIKFLDEHYYIEYSNNMLNRIYFLNNFKNIFYDKKTNLFFLMENFKNDYCTSFSIIYKDGGKMRYKLIE